MEHGPTLMLHLDFTSVVSCSFSPRIWRLSRHEDARLGLAFAAFSAMSKCGGRSLRPGRSNDEEVPNSEAHK
jgi:hypothetical protein